MNLIFNTKQDFLNYLSMYPEEVTAELQKLLDTRFVWETTAILADSDTGTSDDTHRVIGEKPERMQQELIEDSNAQIFRLGFTVNEVEELIKNA